jgi:hypothetical protein
MGGTIFKRHISALVPPWWYIISPPFTHMAETDSWPLILRHELLSTTALLDLLNCPADQRELIESRRRPEKVHLCDAEVVSITIRDQKPMSDSALRRVLTSGTPEEWYQLLNRKVFFWPNRDRLETFLAASAYCDSEQIVITVDTGQLLADYREKFCLSSINSGATLYNPPRRGPETFVRVADYPFEYWRRRRRSPSRAVAEIAVEGGVTNIDRYATEVRRWRGRSPGEVIWSP